MKINTEGVQKHKTSGMKYTLIQVLRGNRAFNTLNQMPKTGFSPSSQWKLYYSWQTSDNDRQKTHSPCFKAMGQHAQRVIFSLKNLSTWEYTLTVRTMVYLIPFTLTPPSSSSYLLNSNLILLHEQIQILRDCFTVES